MSDEIKEIISLLNSSSWSNEANKLLDYITNLQQENKKQKEVIDKTTDIINDYLKEDYSIYIENEIEVDLIVKLRNILKEVSE